MHRRYFIKISALSCLSFPYCHHQSHTRAQVSFDIEVQSDAKVGHLLRESVHYPLHQRIQKEILILGGGVAGLTAAHQLRNKDLVLCELSEQLGGTAGRQSFQNHLFSQGAHYDLEYPTYFGEELLGFLQELRIIHLPPHAHYWQFQDQQYLIDPEQEGRTWAKGSYQEDVLPNQQETLDFLDFTRTFLGKMSLPTRSIDPQYYFLNRKPFLDYLESQLTLSPALIQSIDYQMKDDYGGDSRTVSALAGIYYYASRPYLHGESKVFSPPEGNHYFVQKLADSLFPETIYRGHLVKSIKALKKGFEIEVINVAEKYINQYQVQKVIYAGQKHTVKYLFPQDQKLFEANQYAPWMVLNFVIKDDFLEEGFWQNDILSHDPRFLGFVDSDAQYAQDRTYRVLTAYYCFAPEERPSLLTIEENASEVVHQTLQTISQYLQVEHKQMQEAVQKVFIKVMGHAMPIPRPDYLLQDKNLHRSHADLVYAGVDNARLPLMLEAMDSGLSAVKALGLSPKI